ncbi:MAG: hypothetical protein ACR2HT_04270 [Pyrinomonadaceae bacterium]
MDSRKNRSVGDVGNRLKPKARRETTQRRAHAPFHLINGFSFLSKPSPSLTVSPPFPRLSV